MPGTDFKLGDEPINAKRANFLGFKASEFRSGDVARIKDAFRGLDTLNKQKGIEVIFDSYAKTTDPKKLKAFEKLFVQLAKEQDLNLKDFIQDRVNDYKISRDFGSRPPSFQNSFNSLESQLEDILPAGTRRAAVLDNTLPRNRFSSHDAFGFNLEQRPTLKPSLADFQIYDSESDAKRALGNQPFVVWQKPEDLESYSLTYQNTSQNVTTCTFNSLQELTDTLNEPELVKLYQIPDEILGEIKVYIQAQDSVRTDSLPTSLPVVATVPGAHAEESGSIESDFGFNEDEVTPSSTITVHYTGRDGLQERVLKINHIPTSEEVSGGQIRVRANREFDTKPLEALQSGQFVIFQNVAYKKFEMLIFFKDSENALQSFSLGEDLNKLTQNSQDNPLPVDFPDDALNALLKADPKQVLWKSNANGTVSRYELVEDSVYEARPTSVSSAPREETLYASSGAFEPGFLEDPMSMRDATSPVVSAADSMHEPTYSSVVIRPDSRKARTVDVTYSKEGQTSKTKHIPVNWIPAAAELKASTRTNGFPLVIPQQEYGQLKLLMYEFAILVSDQGTVHLVYNDKDEPTAPDNYKQKDISDCFNDDYSLRSKDDIKFQLEDLELPDGVIKNFVSKMPK